MTEYPIDRVRDAPQPGSNSPLDALRGARDGICSAYRNAPGWFTNNAGLIHPIVRDAMSAMDSLCQDKPLPPKPSVPFTGGQCAGVAYVVTFRFTNPSTGATNTFARTLTGPLGGLTIRQTGMTVGPPPVPIQRFGFISNITEANPKGVDNDLSNGPATQFQITVVSVVRADGLPDTCGNPPAYDPPIDIGPRVTVNVNLPDIRVTPITNIVVPVVILRPEFTFSPNFNATFNIPINIGGQRFNFDGVSFTKEIKTDITAISTDITASQTAIVNSINSSQTAINNNTNTRTNVIQTAINTNTNTQITNSQNSINSSTALSINTAVTNINANTNTQITNSTTSIIARINAVALEINANINALAVVLGVINANLDIALRLIAEINLKPDCPDPILPPGSPGVDDIVKPEEPKTGDDPRIQAVTITLTRLPKKAQWGGGNGAPDKQIAGWFSWKVPDWGFTTPEPINFQVSTFIRPPNVSGYAYTLTNDARGFATEHSLRP